MESGRSWANNQDKLKEIPRPPQSLPAGSHVSFQHRSRRIGSVSRWEATMKIVVLGGNGLIGTKLVRLLRQKGHAVAAASPRSGVNTITCEGLAEALTGARVAIDVTNSASFDKKVALEFFETSCRNLLAAETTAGVQHHIALSIVCTGRLSE